MPDILQVQRPGEGEPTKPDWPEISYGGNPPKRRADGGRVALPWQALALLLAFVLLIGGFGSWRYDTYCRSYSDPCWWHGPLVSSMLVLLPLAGLLAWLYGFAGERQARANAARNEARTLALTRGRYGQPEHVLLHEAAAADVLATLRRGGDVAATWYARRDAADRQLEIAIAPSKIYSGVDTLNEGAKTEIRTDLGAPPALPAPASDAPEGLARERDWLDWCDRAPHLLIAGRTDAGKTTTATALLAERAQAGEQIAVFDPHHQPGKWLGLPTIGGGRDFEAILSGLADVVREMDARFKAFSRGTPTEAFPRLTVLVDEVPAIYDMCVKISGSRRTVIDDRYPQFARRCGSEARKVRLSVWLLSQSHLVQDIGINVAMRENFGRIALGDKARDLLIEEPLREVRDGLVALLRDRPYPAAMEYRNRYYVLDNAGIPALAARAVGGMAQPWQPSAAPARVGGDDLAQRAAVYVQLAGGDRRKAAAGLLARRGTRVRGGWQYEVKEIARSLGMRDEDVSAIGRPN